MSSLGMSFYWGDFVHPPGEVYPKAVFSKALYNERGQRWARDVRLVVGGDFTCQINPGEISARVRALEDAYLVDYQDCGFLINGLPTEHKLSNTHARNLSGNNVVSISWDNVFPNNEYVNTRSFTIEIRAIFLDALDGVIDFKERVTGRGTGGPQWEIYNTVIGPRRVELLDQTPVFHEQEGFVIGTVARMLPPAPLWPDDEIVQLRTVSFSSPVFYGDPFNRPAVFYRTDYKYSFARLGPLPQFVEPNFWWAGHPTPVGLPTRPGFIVP